MTNDLTAEDLERKRKFALELLRTPKDSFRAACAVFGDNTGGALVASSRWPTDLDVLRFMEEAVADVGDDAFLPTKADLCRKVWDMGNDMTERVEDRLKALRLYADVRGFIERQGATINNNILTSNKVMVVKDSGTAEEWEARLLAQQSKLIYDADTPRAV